MKFNELKSFLISEETDIDWKNTELIISKLIEDNLLIHNRNIIITNLTMEKNKYNNYYDIKYITYDKNSSSSYYDLENTSNNPVYASIPVDILSDKLNINNISRLTDICSQTAVLKDIKVTFKKAIEIYFAKGYPGYGSDERLLTNEPKTFQVDQLEISAIYNKTNNSIDFIDDLSSHDINSHNNIIFLANKYIEDFIEKED